MRERCAVCGKRIGRRDENTARWWLGQADDNGIAQLVSSHATCEVAVDMRASTREVVMLVANVLGNARKIGAMRAERR